MNRPAQRNQPPLPPAAADDPSIPVLTERLGLPPLEFDTTLPLIDTMMPVIEPTRPPVEIEPEAAVPHEVQPPAAAPAPAAAVNVLGGTAAPVLPAAPPPGDGRHWARIESELRASILDQVAARLPQEIEAVVAARMAPALKALVDGLAAETRRAAADALREIIDRAVRAELERLRNSNRG
jgi:hypothetical protein